MSTAFDVDQRLNVLRIIVLAMAGGLISATVVLGVVSMQTDPDPALENVLLPLLAILGAMELVAYAVVRAALSRATRSLYEQGRVARDDLTELMPHMFTQTVIPAAMAEGFGLFGAVVFLVTGAWLALVAPLIGVLLLAALLPTRIKFARFVETVTGQTWS